MTKEKYTEQAFKELFDIEQETGVDLASPRIKVSKMIDELYAKDTRIKELEGALEKVIKTAPDPEQFFIKTCTVTGAPIYNYEPCFKKYNRWFVDVMCPLIAGSYFAKKQPLLGDSDE